MKRASYACIFKCVTLLCFAKYSGESHWMGHSELSKVLLTSGSVAQSRLESGTSSTGYPGITGCLWVGFVQSVIYFKWLEWDVEEQGVGEGKAFLPTSLSHGRFKLIISKQDMLQPTKRRINCKLMLLTVQLNHLLRICLVPQAWLWCTCFWSNSKPDASFSLKKYGMQQRVNKPHQVRNEKHCAPSCTHKMALYPAMQEQCPVILVYFSHEIQFSLLMSR